MELFIVDAFTNQIFGGNPAGVVLLGKEGFPNSSIMQQIAAELKHSETAFVRSAEPHTFAFRYFTPEGEVNLCGHATVAAFILLRNEKGLAAGNYAADTAAGRLAISVEPDRIWMEMAPGKLLRYLSPEESADVCRAFGIGRPEWPELLRPCIVDTGLPDILLPVRSMEELDHAVLNREEVIRISKKLQVVGVHMYYGANSPDVTAYCRNFAPLYGIDEEAATGTANGALSYYLYQQSLIREGENNVFVQGISMGRPSVIYSRVNDGRICVGGEAVVSVSGCLRL